jgi:transcriptional regulator with XRE-family HTH domain
VIGSEVERAWQRAVGLRTRLARVTARESQEALAVRVSVSRVTVGSIERGDHPASVLAFARLSRAVGVPLGELLDGTP